MIKNYLSALAFSIALLALNAYLDPPAKPLDQFQVTEGAP